MEEHIFRYKKIINKLIEKSFPILKEKKINIYEVTDLWASADTQRSLWGNMRIRTHQRLRKYPKKHLMGLFAHELSHLEDFETRKINYYFIRGFKNIFKYYIKREEASTDKNTINKGYARQLYAQRLSRWKDPKPTKLKELYISPKEIKKYAQEVGKW